MAIVILRTRFFIDLVKIILRPSKKRFDFFFDGHSPTLHDKGCTERFRILRHALLASLAAQRALFPRGSSPPTPPLPPACSHQCMAPTCAGSAARSPTEASRRRVTSGRGLCPFCAKFGARNSVVITDTASGMPEHWMSCWMQQCPKAPAGPPRRRRSRSRPCRRGRSALDGRWAPAASPGGRWRPCPHPPRLEAAAAGPASAIAVRYGRSSLRALPAKDTI